MDEQTRKALELARDALKEADAPKAWPFAVKQDRRVAIAAIDTALSAPAAPVATAGLHVGNLPTVNQDEYPNLGAWWVQIWDGDRVVGRAYGDTPHAAHEMAVKLSGNAAPSPAPASQPVSEPSPQGVDSLMLLADAYATACMEQGEAHDHVARDALIEALRAWAHPVSDPASPRAPLTDEQILAVYEAEQPAGWLNGGFEWFRDGIKAAERAHGIGQRGAA